MNDSVFGIVETSSRILRLDFSSVEFAKLAEEQNFSPEQIQAVGMVFAHLQRTVEIHRSVSLPELDLFRLWHEKFDIQRPQRYLCKKSA